jgi:CheY-like chemotaxis protein
MHGGEVRADSAGEGAGATFTIRLPLDAPRASRPPGFVRLEGVRLLVVDDSVDARTLLARMLEQQGAEVLEGPDAPRALELVRAARPALVLTDLGMAPMDGFALRRALATLAPELPVVAVTAFTSALDGARLRRQRFAARVTKPVDKATLLRVVSEALLARGPRAP